MLEHDITVYSKKNCPPCNFTKKTLESKGIKFNEIDIETDAAARDYIIELGYRGAPVVVTPTDHWSGFNPNRLNAL